MSINRIELTKERIITIAIIVSAIIALLVYLIFYAPLIRKLRAGYQECKSCERLLTDARNLVETARRSTVERALITEDDVPLAIDELTKLGKSLEISFVSIKPREIAPGSEPGYKVLPIDMEVEAGDRQIAGFLGSLDELKRSIVKIKKIDLAPGREDRLRYYVKISVNMYLSGAGNGK